MTCQTHKNMITTRSGDMSNSQKFDLKRSGDMCRADKNIIMTRSGDMSNSQKYDHEVR